MVENLQSPPAADAKAAGLRYATDRLPGFSRKRSRGSFVYFNAKGLRIHDQKTISRIKHLAIPPAWTSVWISPHPNSHLQATGRDARGRKQYRYHPGWRQQRAENKFDHMLAFGKALPGLRRKVKRDIQLPGMPRRKVLATVVRLLETTLIRVGNDEYARDNRSYGLTTMRKRHASVRSGTIHFGFMGKSGKRHDISLEDPQLARVVSKCQKLPGQELFMYEDDEGKLRDVTSHDVNDYLRECLGGPYTAKDFRTWAGTVLAAIALQNCELPAQQNQAKSNVAAAIEAVAKMLGNTPAVCRNSYIHPAILDSYLNGSTIKSKADYKMKQAPMRKHEDAVLTLLRKAASKAGRQGVQFATAPRTRETRIF